ncbi:phosphonate C-P lyase system protein PhnG [Mangrovibacter phragmitis]|uniref:phosphonate C-P lyase system protein PhnG n=1 Tax=Mangrovibacter phragmitis TaxID=1691903 RepID=UPI003369E5CC
MEKQTERQHWMSVLAHCQDDELARYWKPLNLSPEWTALREPECGMARVQARAGDTGQRFVVGDVTITRAAIRLAEGLCGFSYVMGRRKAHAERCAVLDALLQHPAFYKLILEQVITPLAANRAERQQQRAREIAGSKVDFFTLVRGENP